MKFGHASMPGPTAQGGFLPPTQSYPNTAPASASDKPSRPFENIGKTTISLFGGPGNLASDTPTPEDVPKGLVQGEAFKGVPVLEQAAQVVGGIANIPAFALSVPDRILAGRAWEQNDTAERAKWEALVANNVISQGQAEAMFRRQLFDQAHRGEQKNLFSDFAVPSTDYSLGGQVFGGLGQILSIPQRAWIRTTGGNAGQFVQNVVSGDFRSPVDQRMDSFLNASDADLNYGQGDYGHPELIDIRNRLKAGSITKDQAFDELIIAGFGVSNPTGGIGSIFNEVMSDPTNLLSAGGAFLAKASTKAALVGAKSIATELGSDSIKAFGLKLAERGIEATDNNLVRHALRDAEMRPLVEAALRNANPAVRFLLLKAPIIQRTGTVINNVLGNFSLFGGDDIGRATERQFSNRLASGVINGFGARNYRSLTARAASILGDDVAEVLEDGFDRAAAQIGVQVGNEQNIRHIRVTQALDGIGDPTSSAMGSARRLGGDIAARAQDRVERMKYRLVPVRRGAEGVDQMLRSARTRAVDQVLSMASGKVDREAAKRFVNSLSEDELSLLDFQHYGAVTKDMIAARASAVAEGTFDQAHRVTFIAPRQLTRGVLKALAKAVKRGDSTTARGIIERFDDLYRVYDLEQADDLLLKQLGDTMDQLVEHAPQALTDVENLPTALRQWVDKYGAMGYHLGLRPEDDVLMRPIMDKSGRIVGVNPWVDLVDEKTARQSIGRLQVLQRGLFNNISGAAVVRDAQARFIRLGAERYGLPEIALEGLFSKVMRTASDAETTARGLSHGEMYRAALNTRLPKGLRGRMTERDFAELVLESHEGSLSKVGLTQKFTGKIKATSQRVTGNNWIGQLAERVYPLTRFKNNPFFQYQELLETPFFMLLRGRLPMEDFRRVFTSSGRAEINEEIERTLWAMGLVERKGGFYAGDMAEHSMLTLHGNRAINDAMQRNGIIERLGRVMPNVHRMKDWGVARSFQYEQAKAVSRAVREASPSSWDNYADWLAVRSGARNDRQAVTNYLYDTLAKADPDSAYSQFGVHAFRPDHLGARARISTTLIRGLVYGEADGKKVKWGTLLNDIAEGRRDASEVRDALTNLGADPVYVQRAVDLVTFPKPDDFYKAFVKLGRTKEEIASIRAAGMLHARLQGLSEHEYLSRMYAAAPASLNHLGEVKSTTMFQAIADSFSSRGREVVERGDPRIAEIAIHGEAHLPDLRLRDDWETTPVKDLTPAEQKARGFVMARRAREANPELGLPPRLDGPDTLDGGIPVAQGASLDDIRKSMGVDEFDIRDATRPDLYMTHPRSGYRVRNDKPAPQVFRGPNGEPMLRDVKPDEFRMNDSVPIPGTERPLTHVFRAISEEDWEGIKARGFIQTDGRMNLSMDEGTVASTQDPSFYLPGRNQASAPLGDHPGRILRIKVDPEDGWLMNKADSYIKTPKAIPIDRVEMVSPKIVTTKGEKPSKYGGRGIDTIDTYVDRPGVDPARGRLIQEAMDRGDVAESQRLQREAVGNAGFGTLSAAKFARVTKDGRPVHIIGPVDGEDWFDMLDNVMGDEVLREKADWYIDMRRGFLALAENDPQEAARLITLFGVSQLNTSPVDGMRFISRALAAHRRGETLPIDQTFSGLNTAAVKRLLEEGSLDQAGLGQKLVDFIDSLLGRNTRTAGVLGPDEFKPWGPAAADIWAKRDLGFIDKKMSQHLGRVYGGKAVYEEGVGFHVTTRKGEEFLIPESKITGGAPTDLEYDHIVEFYNQRAQDANARNFLDRSDWSAAEMQALGWFRAKFAMGDRTGSPLDAFHKNVSSVHWEAAPGPNSPFSEVFPTEVPEEVLKGITKDVAAYVQMEAQRLTGIDVVARFDGVGTWEGAINPNAAFEVLGSPEDAQAFARVVGYLAQQEGVPVSRLHTGGQLANPSAGRFHAVDWQPADGAPGATHAEAEEALRQLAETSPLAKGGASIVRYDDGTYGVRSMWMDFDAPTSGKGTVPLKAFQDAHPDDTLETVGRMEPNRVVVESSYHENVYKDMPSGEGHLQWLRENGYGQVADKLAGEGRHRAALFYERTYRKHYAHGLDQWRAERAVTDDDWAERAGPLLDDLDAAYGESRALDATRGSDDLGRATDAADRGDVLFQRHPRGTLGAVAFDAHDRRARIFLNAKRSNPDTLLHELSHQFAEQSLDPSGRKAVLDVFNEEVKGIGRVAPGRRRGPAPVPTTTWTEEVHEWFAKQMTEWARTGESPARHLDPIFAYYGKFLKTTTASMTLSPKVKGILDEITARPVARASASNVDEAGLMNIMLSSADASARNARDLIHFRTNRSWIERSVNHPYFGMYPLSYMWGKVLPELVEFLVHRPFGMKAPLVAYNTVADVYRAVMLQQENDPELRKYLEDNEPALRAIALMVPGVPWDLPVNSPLWMRRITEAVATQQQRVLEGKTNPDGSPASIDLTKIDAPKIISDTAGYALNPVKGFGDIIDSATGLAKAGALGINQITGQPIPSSEPDARTQAAPALTTEQPADQTLNEGVLAEPLNDAASDLLNALSPAPHP